MAIARCEVSIHAADDIPRDFAVNTVYHNITDIDILSDTDWTNHANEVRDAFTGADSDDEDFTLFNGRVVEVKAYDMADAKPRPVKAHVITTPGIAIAAADLGPRQVALCLSYYAARNLPTTRGRLFLGPINSPTPVPGSGLMGLVLNLGHALFNIGGANVHWQQRSEKTGVTSTITNWWVDNRWDTQRRRLVKATSRVTGSA
jgi:hypothetical protein